MSEQKPETPDERENPDTKPKQQLPEEINGWTQADIVIFSNLFP
jgi:hypothetical protein